jgi:hypothetical protein
MNAFLFSLVLVAVVGVSAAKQEMNEVDVHRTTLIISALLLLCLLEAHMFFNARKQLSD